MAALRVFSLAASCLLFPSSLSLHQKNAPRSATGGAGSGGAFERRSVSSRTRPSPPLGTSPSEDGGLGVVVGSGGSSGGRRDFLSSCFDSVVASLASSYLLRPCEAAAATTEAADGDGDGDDRPPPPPPAAVDFRAVASDVADLVARVPNRGPPLVRLAWHSSGTYDLITGTGGSSGGTIRFDEELAHGENAGLGQSAIRWLEPIKAKHGDGLSYADLYTLAGVVAIKAMGGPAIPWSYGRIDAPDPSSVPPDGRLPAPDSGPPGADASDAAHLRNIFYRMGFNDQEIVALSGAHSLGRCNKWASGYDGTWTADPVQFDNSYFVQLRNLRWREREWNGPVQYEARDSGEGGRRKPLMMLPTDLALVRDPSFRRYVRLYARDRDRFERDFAEAFRKLEELGTVGLSPANLWT